MSALTKAELQIVLNGADVATPARTLLELVELQQLSELKIATAINGHFVPAAKRATTLLNDGDRVEIVSPRQGG